MSLVQQSLTHVRTRHSVCRLLLVTLAERAMRRVPTSTPRDDFPSLLPFVFALPCAGRDHNSIHSARTRRHIDASVMAADDQMDEYRKEEEVDSEEESEDSEEEESDDDEEMPDIDEAKMNQIMKLEQSLEDNPANYGAHNKLVRQGLTQSRSFHLTGTPSTSIGPYCQALGSSLNRDSRTHTTTELH